MHPGLPFMSTARPIGWLLRRARRETPLMIALPQLAAIRLAFAASTGVTPASETEWTARRLV
jgi:hypothetical protein